MRLTLLLIPSLLALAACSKPGPPPDPCVIPNFTATAKAGTYMGAREQASICVKRAAYELARKGGPLAPIGDAAMAQCSAQEAATVAALKTMGPVYDYQEKQIHDDLVHNAARAATTARAIGCGGPPEIGGP